MGDQRLKDEWRDWTQNETMDHPHQPISLPTVGAPCVPSGILSDP